VLAVNDRFERIFMNGETTGKIKDAIELLLQCMELFPDARKHVELYVSHAQVHELQEQLKKEFEV
jgi:hypothetical protein